MAVLSKFFFFFTCLYLWSLFKDFTFRVEILWTSNLGMHLLLVSSLRHSLIRTQNNLLPGIISLSLSFFCGLWKMCILYPCNLNLLNEFLLILFNLSFQ